MSSTIGRDARKQTRSAIELSVTVSDAANRVTGGIHFDAADISTGGAFLRTDLLLEVGELVTLQFRLPQGPSVRTAGRVTRVSRGQAKEVAGMGVEFIDLKPEDRAAIEERLRR